MKLFLIILFTSIYTLFSQKNPLSYDMDFLLYKDIDFIDSNEDYLKVCNFFKVKKYDSSYVYASVRLDKKNISRKEKDILLFIQGLSAIEKSLFKKAKLSFLDIEDEFFFKEFYLRLGYVYLNLEEYENAIGSYRKYENKFKEEYRNNQSLYKNLGIAYIHKSKLDLADECFLRAINYIEKDDIKSMILLKINLANVYYEKYIDEKAIPLFIEAYDLSKEYPDVELKRFTSHNMAVVEKNRKNYKESINYYLEYDKIKDSIFSRDRIWELTEKDKQIAVAQKQQEIALQDEKLKRQKIQRDGLIFGASGLLIFLGGLGFFYKKLQSQNKFITKQKEALNTANKTKDYLFSVVSHDLRSPINTIKNQHVELKEHIANNNLPAIQEVNNKAIAVTESTSHLLNNVLHWSLEQSNQLLFNPQEIALRPTIEHVLYDYRMLVEANNITIESDLENALINADKESIKIVLRNVLDNAVKYGGKEIMVTTGISSEEYAFIKIEDSGVGIPEEKLKKINSLTNLSIDKIDRSEGVGLGVILCHTLVKKNKGILTFASEPNNGTEVMIELPNIPV